MSRTINPTPQFFDASGDPLAYGKVYFYESGTSTDLTTYADANQTIANTQPLVLTADGRMPNSFYSGLARVVLKDKNDVQIWDKDPVGDAAIAGSIADWSAIITYGEGDIVGYNGDLYRSIQNNNINKTPTTNADYWEEVRYIQVWNEYVTYSTDDIVQRGGFFYRSKTNSNIGNDPVGDTTNWGGTQSTDIADGSITLVKMEDMSQNEIIGRVTAGTGSPEHLTSAQGRTALGLGALATLNTVDTAQIDNDAITTAKILNDAVTTDKILDANVTTAKIADNAVTFAKVEDIAQDTILGRTAAGAGDIEELSISTVQTSLGLVGHNFIIGGAFDFWKRGSSFAVSSTTSYMPDMWSTDCVGPWAGTVSRQGTVGSYRCRVQRTAGQTGVGTFGMANALETADSVPAAGKTITLSYLARAGANFSAASSEIVVYLRTGTGTNETLEPLGNFPTGAGNSSSNQAITTTETRYSHTFTVGPTVKQWGIQFWFVPTGTAGADDWFEIGEVKVEIGENATDFIRSGGSVAGEADLCGRYCRKTYRLDIDPGTAADFTGAIQGNFADNAAATNYLTYTFPAMRSTPTVTFYSPETGTSGSYRNVTDATDYSATATNVGDSAITFKPTASTGVTIGDAFAFHVLLEANL